MDIADIRRENIRKYIKDNFRTRAEFAEKINKSPAQVAMWFMKSQGRRDIGEKLARDIETALELPSGWMDRQTLSTTHATRYETTTPVSASHATGYEGENDSQPCNMMELDMYEQALIELIKDQSADQKAMLLDIAKTLTKAK